MNYELKAYLSVDSDYVDIEKTKKLFSLLLRKEIEVSYDNNLIELSKLNVECLNTIKVSLKAIKGDLNFKRVSLIIVPFFSKQFKSIALGIDKDGIFYLYDIILNKLKENKLNIEELKSIIRGVPNDILITVKNYIQLNRSIIDTSKLMFTHRNTINYRINKFIYLTGINIRDLSNAMLVYFILSFMEL